MSHRNPIQTGSIDGEELAQTLFRKLKIQIMDCVGVCVGVCVGLLTITKSVPWSVNYIGEK